jgi:hypothetical protein
MLKIITAKFSSKCHASGKRLKKGDTIVYDVSSKLVYHPNHSPSQMVTDDGRYIREQEEAYFDNFCQANNI